jgi:hypothetical protein
MRLPRLALLLPAIALLAFFGPTVGLSHAAKKAKRTKPPVIGIADQKPEFLADSTFLSLGVKHARVAVAWDALTVDYQRERLERWMSSARAAGVQPLVTFDRSSVVGRTKYLPSPKQFQAQFRAFRKRYPFVRDFSAWNEANHPGQPTYRKPHILARYYKAMKRSCKGCRVLAADLLDLPSMVKWTKKYMKRTGAVRYWGLHNYVTANRRQLKRTKQLLKVTRRGELWLTETGGLVAKRNNTEIKLPQGRAHAARVTRFILRDMVNLDRRITRVYLYHWSSSSPTDTWDSSFVGHDQTARPSLGVLKQALSQAAKAKAKAKKKRRR